MPDRFWGERQDMVEHQIRRRGIHDARVLDAMAEVPRHIFIPAVARDMAYSDTPLVIGNGQTISQPYIVALMTSSLELTGSENVLEVGTGSGYQAAILSRLAAHVHSVELIMKLARRAARALRRLGCSNVETHVGDGSVGWHQAAPYDAIIVTAAAPAIPPPLVDQLVVGGRMVLPVSAEGGMQLLTLVRKSTSRTTEHVIANVAFVLLHGRFGVKE